MCWGPTIACLLGGDGSLEKKSPTKRRALRGFLSVPGGSSSTDGSAAAKYFRRSMLAQDAYQVDSASDRIKLGLARARAGGKQVGRLPVLTPEQIEQCRRMADEGSGLRHIARVTTCSPATVKKALDAVPAGDPIIHTKPPGAARTFPSRL